MTDVSIVELAAHTSKIIWSVRNEGKQYVITHYGRPVATITPIKIPEGNKPSQKDRSAWDRLKALGKEMNSPPKTIEGLSISSSTGPSLASYSRVTVDAYFFLNAFNPLGNSHAEFHRLFEFFYKAATPLICPTIVIAEIAELVMQKTTNWSIAREFALAVQELAQLKLVDIDIDLIQNAVGIVDNSFPRGNDAIYAAVARSYSTTFITLKEYMRNSTVTDFVVRYPFEALEDLRIGI